MPIGEWIPKSYSNSVPMTIDDIVKAAEQMFMTSNILVYNPIIVSPREYDNLWRMMYPTPMYTWRELLQLTLWP